MSRTLIAAEVMAASRGPVLSSTEAGSLAAALMDEVKRSDDLPEPIRTALIATAAGMMTHSQDAETTANETAALMARIGRSGASGSQ
jgi:hypothetical protein